MAGGMEGRVKGGMESGILAYLLRVRSYPVHLVGGLQLHLGVVVVGRLPASVVHSSGVLYRLFTLAHYFFYH
jgi:hypothetical protein